MELIVNMSLLTLLAVVTVGIARQRNLFGAIILFSAYSFLMATLFIGLDAVDVAMTEAAVGAGVSTVFLLAALHLTRSLEQRSAHAAMLPLFVSVVVGAALVWGTIGLSPFGASDSVIHRHIAPTYLADAIPVMGVPNVVTAVLANYRGFDTLGEVTVIFTAGIAIMLLLRGSGRRRRAEREAREAKGREAS
jgi:multicomponent Na+:H+ antiporter subunit B